MKECASNGIVSANPDNVFPLLLSFPLPLDLKLKATIMISTWKGVYPAITTKFTPNDALDIDLHKESLLRLCQAGVDGVVIGGSLGEASTLRQEEKELLVKASLEVAAGKVPVILNIAEGSTAEAVRQIGLGEAWGADGFMALPPMRYKSDPRETVYHFAQMAGATRLPIMVYNNPVDYKIDITADMFEQLLQFENIGAVKESTRDVTNITRLINRFGDRLSILCGVDTLAMEEILLGANGWVAGLVCAFPEETVCIYRLLKANRIEEARAIYRWFMPLLELDIHPKLVQYIKFCESKTGMGSEYVRAPRLCLQGEERQQLEAIVSQALAKRPNLPDYLHLPA
jgi:4-hydroxy-tetrahydrodipicolinate synthase